MVALGKWETSWFTHYCSGSALYPVWGMCELVYRPQSRGDPLVGSCVWPICADWVLASPAAHLGPQHSTAYKHETTESPSRGPFARLTDATQPRPWGRQPSRAHPATPGPPQPDLLLAMCPAPPASSRQDLSQRPGPSPPAAPKAIFITVISIPSSYVAFMRHF